MHKIFLPLILIAIFIAGFFFARDALKNINIPQTIREVVVNNTKETCGAECRRLIAEEVAKAVASTSAKTKEVVPASSAPKSQVSHISLDGTYSATSLAWVDVPGAEVSFDLSNDYGKGAKVAWEASLKVANANGTAYARIFDSTHGIAVDGSEIKVSDNASYQRVSSGNLNLWAGRNVYKVQIKSLNSFEVFYTGGRMRITY